MWAGAASLGGLPPVSQHPGSLSCLQHRQQCRYISGYQGLCLKLHGLGHITHDIHLLSWRGWSVEPRRRPPGGRRPARTACQHQVWLCPALPARTHRLVRAVRLPGYITLHRREYQYQCRRDSYFRRQSGVLYYNSSQNKDETQLAPVPFTSPPHYIADNTKNPSTKAEKVPYRYWRPI